AAGVVVRDRDAHGAVLQRAGEGFARVDLTLVGETNGDFMRLNDLMASVKCEYHETLLTPPAQRRQMGQRVGGLADARAVAAREKAAGQFERREDLTGLAVADAVDARQFRERGHLGD